jgi:hypothetical protein
MQNRTVCATIIVALLASVAVSTAAAEKIYGVTQDQFLVSWESDAPEALLTGVAVSGLQSNETVVGIDLRPATGVVYALGSFSYLYTLNLETGEATQVGDQFSTRLSGSSFGFDFNPTVDRIRVVSNTGQNMRLNPNTGGVAAVDAALKYQVGDVNEGTAPNVVSAAYTNNFKGATSTTLYDIDSGLDVLATQIPPNDGGLNTVGSIGTDVTDIGGFDISGATGAAYLVIRDAGLSKSTFWNIDLGTGAATALGEIGGGEIITSMTVVPEPASIMLLAAMGLLVGVRRR